MVKKLLVANRGEIALRIFRTCERLGIATVAVTAADDTGSLHARSAGATVGIASYLDPAEIVRAARDAGADAVHPGYGFLAESAELAEAVESAGLVFVGPTAEALRAAGDKARAKEVAVAAGVPVVPWGEAEEIGFPLLVKASAGGGGRGMRLVRTAAELDDALAAARREAEAAFGDPTVFCERYLERPRHVEVQLMADTHGTVLALGDRDCSVQRRHQKLLEEAPAPGLTPELRAELHAAAIAFARAIAYRGAGTAEFALTPEGFFFLELNGRIQVEHPVTEAVTGLDVVELQLRVAAGEPLDLEPRVTGHALEARLYAEDPRSFLPQAGRLERLVLPTSIRVDAGVEQGDDVGTRYDPLLAKLIAHGATRAEAIDRLAACARRDRRRRRDDEPPLPALALRAPGVPRRHADDGIPDGEPAALRATAAHTRSSLAGALSPQPPRPRTATAADRRARGRGCARGRRPADADGADARDGAPRTRRTRRRGGGAAAARRPRGDEDGDADRGAIRGTRHRGARRGGRRGRSGCAPRGARHLAADEPAPDEGERGDEDER